MTELATEIRKAVVERVDRAPMPPTIESIDFLDRSDLTPIGRPQGRRPLLVGTAVVLVLALFGVMAVVIRTQSRDRVSVGTEAAPSDARTPLAGRTLPARFGLPKGLPGLSLATEFDRPVGLAATDVAWLPTGPLGPFYAQSLHAPYDAATPVLSDGLGVLTVLPDELQSVVDAASGGGASQDTMVGARPATLTQPFSSSDDRVVSWQQDGTAIVVVAPASLDDAGLLAAAASVTTIPQIPLLDPLPVVGDGSGRVNGFYSMAPGAYIASDPTAPDRVTKPWTALITPGPLSLAMGTLLASITVDGDPVSIREVGDPTSHYLGLENVAFNWDTGAVIWDTDNVLLTAAPGDSSLPKGFVIYGSTPSEVTTIRLGLDDGTTVEGPTYDAGRGWPVRGYLLVVPNGREVVHLEALSSDGTVRYSGAPAWPDGAHPSSSRPGGVLNVARCGSVAPSYAALDC